MAPKAKAAPIDTNSILGTALLANVNIRMWEGRKHDKEVTERASDAFKADHTAGRFNKNLFGGRVPELSAIITAGADLRMVHYRQTLPWFDDGQRLLSTANFLPYTEAMREIQKRFDSAVDHFVKKYPALVTAARDRLHLMYRPSDYPAVETLRSKFSVTLEFLPLPAKEDFRIELPKKEMDRIAKSVEDRLTKSTALAMEAAWQRLGDAILKVRGKLDDGKHLRDSMIDRLRDVADVLGRLNITQDAALETARTRVLTELASFDADTLKGDESARQKAAKSADAILKSMAGVYAPSKKEDA